jgi:hypothetical protein
MIKLILFSLFTSLIIFISCKKDNDLQQNLVPIANAGSSQTITLPVDSVTLSGSGSDSDGHVVAYLWSQVSGPTAAVLVNPGSPSCKAQSLKQGTYTFQLMVTDNKGATGVNSTTVIVNPPPIQTLTLQPSNNPNEIVIANDNGTDISHGSSPDMPIEAWTSSSNPFTVRGIIKFDISSIPSSATIISANLYLYSYPSPTLNGDFTDANFGTSNTLLVQQVTSNWSPATTNWFNQPSATTTNQVVVPNTTQSTQDLNLDVKPMVQSMVSNNTNYGFFLKLLTEVTYNSRIFVASYNSTYTTKYPKLVVVYQ